MCIFIKILERRWFKQAAWALWEICWDKYPQNLFCCLYIKEKRYVRVVARCVLFGLVCPAKNVLSVGLKMPGGVFVRVFSIRYVIVSKNNNSVLHKLRSISHSSSHKSQLRRHHCRPWYISLKSQLSWAAFRLSCWRAQCGTNRCQTTLSWWFVSTLSSCSLLSDKYGWRLTKASHRLAWWNNRGWWNHYVPQAWVMLPDVDDVPLLVQSLMTSFRDEITGEKDSCQTKAQKALAVARRNSNLTSLLWNVVFCGTLSPSHRDYLAVSQECFGPFKVCKWIEIEKDTSTSQQTATGPTDKLPAFCSCLTLTCM